MLKDHNHTVNVMDSNKKEWWLVSFSKLGYFVEYIPSRKSNWLGTS